MVMTMARPEPCRNQRQQQPVQVPSSAQKVVICRRSLPSSQQQQRQVYKQSPRANCSNNNLAIYPLSRPSSPPPPYYQNSNCAVSSVQFSPAPMPLLPSLCPRPPKRRKSCPDLLSMVSQTIDLADDLACGLEEQVRDCIECGEDVFETMSVKLDQVITVIDEGLLSKERELVLSDPFDAEAYRSPRGIRKISKYSHTAADYFSKAYSYYNSRLPARLPPLKLSVYTPTYTLLRLAAQYSRQVYEKPIGPERQCYIDADRRHGTKAMVIKSIPFDDLNAIVFAIRGTQSFRDWAINMKTEPTSPEGFLDDTDNLCHAGFLSVARKMVAPVAARLRSLLAEDPNRIAHSLVITGHSAGGAVGSLLFCHMLSEHVQSELTHLRRFFTRVHCVTFGAPPVSIQPLQLPRWNSLSPNKSMFFAFINEGDPVPRAEKSYIVSLLDLYLSPTKAKGRCNPVTWKVPRATLSAAGRLVLLRKNESLFHFVYPSTPGRKRVEACVITHDQLREVVFGDPLVHTMDLYARRIDELVMNAVRFLPFAL